MFRKALIALALTLATVLVVANLLALRRVPPHPFFDNFDDRQMPLVISHADDSGSGFVPGNTIAYLEDVAARGVDVLEMDVHMTADNHIVLLHDETVDRTTDGSGSIYEMTLAEAQQLEVGGNWTKDDGATYPYRGAGVRIPTLAEVFERFPDYPMLIEIKQAEPSPSAELCALITRYGMQTRVIIASSRDAALEAFRDACPDVATAAHSDEVRRFVMLNFVWLSGLLSPDYQAFQVPVTSGDIPVVTPRFVRAAQRRNLHVQPWTINDAAEMRRLLEMGVDGLITDRPDVLREILGR